MFPALTLVPSNTQSLSFEELFGLIEQRAKTVVAAPLTTEVVLDLAQYVDLVDAGFASPFSWVYRQAVRRLAGHVQANLFNFEARARFGQSAILQALLDVELDRELGWADTQLAA